MKDNAKNSTFKQNSKIELNRKIRVKRRIECKGFFTHTTNEAVRIKKTNKKLIKINICFT